MDRDKATELLTEDNFMSCPDKHTTMRGLQLLSKYMEDIKPSFEHDIMYACDFEETVTQMSEEEVVQMGKWGWFEEDDSWAHY